MSYNKVDQEIVWTAYEIGKATAYEELLDSQLSFWLSVQELMRTGGYGAVRKRMAYVSEDLAKAVASANFKSLRKLCSAEVSTLRPSLPDNTIIGLLSHEEGQDLNPMMVLQILAESRGDSAHG